MLLGCSLQAWLRILAFNRFAVHPRYWPAALGITAVSLHHSLLALLERVRFGHRIAQTRLDITPIIIIGHWRTGTTFLHELLALDSRHSAPTTYECFSPHHFLLSEPFITPLRLRRNPRRPMDRMPIHWDHPQEDETALCVLGIPSPYMLLVFPRHRARYEPYYAVQDLPNPARQRWERAFLRFLKRVCLQRPGRLVLKNPAHTFRIPTLLALFPEARFVYCVRNPFDVFGSMRKTRGLLSPTQRLQPTSAAKRRESILHAFAMMHDAFERDRHLIPADRLVVMRFEQLIQNPVAQVQALYAHFGISGFDGVQPALSAYVAARRGYRPDTYALPEQIRREIRTRWHPYFRTHHYPEQKAAIP